MEGSCQRNHLSFPRIMSELTLTQLIGLLESKVLRSLRDLLKLFVPSYSQRSSRRVTGSLHVLHPKGAKMQELLRPMMEVPATSRERCGNSCVRTLLHSDIVCPFETTDIVSIIY